MCTDRKATGSKRIPQSGNNCKGNSERALARKQSSGKNTFYLVSSRTTESVFFVDLCLKSAEFFHFIIPAVLHLPAGSHTHISSPCLPSLDPPCSQHFGVQMQ